MVCSNFEGKKHTLLVTLRGIGYVNLKMKRYYLQGHFQRFLVVSNLFSSMCVEPKVCKWQFCMFPACLSVNEGFLRSFENHSLQSDLET